MVQYSTVQYSTVQYGTVQYCTKGFRGQKVPRVSRDKGYQGCLCQKLRRSTQGQGFLKNSFQTELNS